MFRLVVLLALIHGSDSSMCTCLLHISKYVAIYPYNTTCTFVFVFCENIYT